MSITLRKIMRRIPTTRIPTVTRISLNRMLIPYLKRLPAGNILDIGSSSAPYRRYIPRSTYVTMDINAASGADIIADIHDEDWRQPYLEHFDAVIITEVLEHLHDPKCAIGAIHDVLKPGGECILTTRFMYPYHANPKDYYRYTHDSLALLFEGFSDVDISHHGNAVQLWWLIMSAGHVRGAIFNLLNPLFARIDFNKTDWPFGYLVRAVK